MSKASGNQADGDTNGNEDTRWMKYGSRAGGEFRDIHSGGVVEHDTTDVVPRFQIHPVTREDEVRISLAITPSGDERAPSVSAMGSFTSEQILELADALEEVAGAARDGEIR
jgi:hypothetical protein